MNCRRTVAMQIESFPRSGKNTSPDGQSIRRHLDNLLVSHPRRYHVKSARLSHWGVTSCSNSRMELVAMMITHALDSNTNSARLRRLGWLNLLEKAASHLSDQSTEWTGGRPGVCTTTTQTEA
jgi:hypothetical protein